MAAHQAPLSMGFSEQEYWSGLPCPPPGDLLNPGIEPALAGEFFTTSATWEAQCKTLGAPKFHPNVFGSPHKYLIYFHK